MSSEVKSERRTRNFRSARHENLDVKTCTGPHEKNNNLMQTYGGTKPAVDQRLIRGTASALRSWLLTNVPTPICLCKPFSCKAYPGIASCRTQNPDIPRARQGGARHGRAAGRGRARRQGKARPGGRAGPGGDWDSGGSVHPGKNYQFCPPGQRRHTSATIHRKHECTKSYLNRMGEHGDGLIAGTTAAVRSWLLTSGQTPFCFCKCFSCKACPGSRMVGTSSRPHHS